jgi:hypothetical protein
MFLDSPIKYPQFRDWIEQQAASEGVWEFIDPDFTPQAIPFITQELAELAAYHTVKTRYKHVIGAVIL